MSQANAALAPTSRGAIRPEDRQIVPWQRALRPAPPDALTDEYLLGVLAGTSFLLVMPARELLAPVVAVH